MSIATKVAAMLAAVRRQDLEGLSPAERQRFANLCRYVASLADPQISVPPRPGVSTTINPVARPNNLQVSGSSRRADPSPVSCRRT